MVVTYQITLISYGKTDEQFVKLRVSYSTVNIDPNVYIEVCIS